MITTDGVVRIVDLGLAKLADSHLLLEPYGVLPPKEILPKGKAAALKAVEIDDTVPETRTSLAYARMFCNCDWLGFERKFKRAIVLNPNYPTAHRWFGWCLAAMVRRNEAMVEMNSLVVHSKLLF